MENINGVKEILDGNYLTKKQVAEKLGLTTKTIENYIKAKKLKAYKLGNRIVVLEEDLSKLVKEL